MRRLNGKLFLILLASVTVGGALVHGLHAYQVHRHSGMFLQAAQRAQDAGHFEESAENLRRFLLLSPGDADVTGRLAKLLFDHRQDRQAQLLYTQVVHQQPSNDEARRRLVDASLRLGAYQDAKYHLDNFLLKSHKEEGELYLQLGTCQQALGDYVGAQKSYEKAIQFAPDHVAAYSRLAFLLVDRLENGTGAKKQLQDMVARNPKSAEAYLLRAAFLQAHAGDTVVQTAFLGPTSLKAYERPREMLRRALADTKAALELTPNDAKALLFAAQAAISCERPDEARGFADRALKINPAEPVAYVVLASNELRQNHQPKAIECLKRGLEATKDNPLVLLTLANLQLDAGDVAAAKPLIDRLRRIDSFTPVVRYLDARILIDKSDWANAASRLQGMSTDLARWPQFQKESLYWLAHCEARLSRSDSRIAAYRSALDIDPFWPPARMGLAEALRESGRKEESDLEYQRLLRLPNIPIRASIEAFQAAVAKNLSRAPNDPVWGEIEKERDAVALRLSTENRLLLNAQVAVAEGKVEESKQDLRAAIAANPKNPTAWVSLLAVEGQRGQWTDAEKLLGEMQKQFKDGVPYRLARAECLFRRYGQASKSELRALAKAPPSYSAAERQQLASGLARAALDIKDYEQAERLCRLVADSDPTNLQIRLVLFDLAQQAESVDAMKSALEEVRKIEHDGFYSKYGEAVKLLLQGKQNKDEKLLDRALEKAGEAKVQRPDWPRSTLLIAEINDARGRRDAAIEAYTSAMELGERDPRLAARLVSLLFEQGNFPKAKSILQRFESEKASFSTELWRLDSHTSMQTGDVKRALETAQQTAEHSKDVRDQIWYGQVLSISPGRADDAEKVLKQATKDAPKYPGGWIELIQLYKRSPGKLDQAQKVLAEAKTKIDVKQSPLALPYACELLGQNSDAEHYYLDAMKAAPGDHRIQRAIVEFQARTGKIDGAESLLQQMIADAGEANDAATLQWSRRTLAGLLINSPAYQKHVEARKLIDKNLDGSPKSDADLRMSALVDASLTTRESRQRAIENLELLSQRPGVLTLDDHLVLAKLYWSAGEGAKARDQLRTLATQGRSAQYTLAYAEVLLEEKEYSEAENWVRRLEELAPTEFGTAMIRARLFARQERYNQAYDCLSKFIQDDSGDPRARTLRRRLASARFEEFGKELARHGRKEEAEKFFAQAETWLPEFGGDANQPTLLHVLFSIRRERTKEAVAEIERIQQGKDMDALAKACLAIAQVNTNEHDVLERASRVAAHVVSVKPSADAWIALGALQDRTANYDAAEHSYREGLALASARVDALNNLAYILALRKKELPEARKLIDQALASGGPRGALEDSLAMIELAMGNTDAALSDASQACSEDPNPVHLFHLARLQMTKGDRKAATEALETARKRGLKPASLHPLERPTLTELETQLDVAAP
jgi:cellulose synthase operon protein C